MDASGQNHLLWEDMVRQLEGATRQLLTAVRREDDSIAAALALRSSSIQRLILHSASFGGLAKETQSRLLTCAKNALEEGALAIRSIEALKQEAIRECIRGQRLRSALAQQNQSDPVESLHFVG